MKMFSSNGLPIAYRDEGSGPLTLFFIHGMYADQTQWNRQLLFFKDRYRVITVDMAGHGQSGRERDHWSIDGLADDVINLWKALELTNLVVIGHSAGAAVALCAITKRPGAVQGFVAVDYFKNAGQPLPDAYQAQAEAILEANKTNPADTGERYAHMALLTDATPEAVKSRVVRDFRNAYPPMTQPMLEEAFAAWKMEKELLPKLDKKLYMINVDYMPTNEEPLKTLLNAGYEVIHLHGTSHYPMLENPDALNHALDIAVEKIEDEADFILKDAH